MCICSSLIRPRVEFEDLFVPGTVLKPGFLWDTDSCLQDDEAQPCSGMRPAMIRDVLVMCAVVD